MDTFRLESIVAKSDYWLAVLFCLIIVCLYEVLSEETQKNRLIFWKLMKYITKLYYLVVPLCLLVDLLFIFPLKLLLVFLQIIKKLSNLVKLIFKL